MYTSHEKAKADILEAGRRLYMRGFVAANDGNISAKMTDGTVWATPSGVSKGFMDLGSLIRVTPDGEVVEGAGKVSSEIKLHLAVYAENPELGAVVHAHPPAATAYASLGRAFDLAISTECVISLGVVPCAPYALPGSERLAEDAAKFAREYNACLLQGHGAASWGRDVMSALYRMESVEHTVITYEHMLALGGVKLLTAKQVDELVALRAKFGITLGGVPRGS